MIYARKPGGVGSTHGMIFIHLLIYRLTMPQLIEETLNV